jgi:trk system potassium uptake protein TrkA
MAKDNHQEFAVIGLGRFGTNLAIALEEHGHTVMAIDINPRLVQDVVDRVTHAAALDSTDENALEAIDISAFETVIVAIGNDFEANILTTTTLKSMGVRRVICKAQTSRQCDILTRLGADRVIQPEQNSALRLAEELSTPDIIERFNLGQNYSVAEIFLPDCLAWQTLAQTDIQNKHHITILLIKRGDEVHIAPKADIVLQEDDILIVFGQNQDITHFTRLK